MFSFLSDFFAKKKIDCFGFLPLCECAVTRPYLLEKKGIGSFGTVCMLAVPYYTKYCDDPERNVSAYAVSKDYHLFYQQLFGELIPLLENKFPQHHFAGFADHSPIDEVEAASRAGLGAIGNNRLLLTDKYSSYVFLGEIITDAVLPCRANEPLFCNGCNHCQKKCPMNSCGVCLSALTQKKGELTEAERRIILDSKTVWGCDLCQQTCPYTADARDRGELYTPIPFFWEDPLPHLTPEALLSMSDDQFAQRAYSWRGRETILRNLCLFEEIKKEAFEC